MISFQGAGESHEHHVRILKEEGFIYRKFDLAFTYSKPLLKPNIGDLLLLNILGIIWMSY